VGKEDFQKTLTHVVKVGPERTGGFSGKKKRGGGKIKQRGQGEGGAGRESKNTRLVVSKKKKQLEKTKKNQTHCCQSSCCNAKKGEKTFRGTVLRTPGRKNQEEYATSVGVVKKKNRNISGKRQKGKTAPKKKSFPATLKNGEILSATDRWRDMYAKERTPQWVSQRLPSGVKVLDQKRRECGQFGPWQGRGPEGHEGQKEEGRRFLPFKKTKG